MRRVVLIATAALALAAPAVAAAPAFKATLTAAGHKPKINVHWPYQVKVTYKGLLLGGKLSVAIVDPLGTAHPVQYGANKKYITNVLFKGLFRDYVIWPPASAIQGVVLKFRATVVTAKGKAVLVYNVSPHK
jgi:hypothetical protein